MCCVCVFVRGSGWGWSGVGRACVHPQQKIHPATRRAIAYLDHDEGVGGLHGEEEVVVVVLAAHLRKLEGGLHHAQGRVAVEGEDARGERTFIIIIFLFYFFFKWVWR